MSITTDEHGTISVDGPEAVSFFVWNACLFALGLEVNTGMKSRHSALAAAKRHGFTDKGTKKGALKQMVQMRQAADPSWTVPDTIQRALAV